MSYRKITVDGKEYEWVAGKSALKIKGPDKFSKVVLYADPTRINKVTPKDVVDAIHGCRIPVENQNYTVDTSFEDREVW